MNTVIQQYKVVKHWDAEKFEFLVKKLLDQGFILHGYMSSSCTSNGSVYFSQVLIKYKKQQEQ